MQNSQNTQNSQNSQNSHHREGELRKFRPLVRRLAYHMVSRMPANVEVDDLIQVGMLGLNDAMERGETSLGSFESFAGQRIRGAMLDELRETDWVSRSMRKAQKDIDKAARTLTHRLCRMPTDTEMAQALELPLAEYQHLLAQVHGSQMVSLEDFSVISEGEETGDEHSFCDWGADPLALLQQQGTRERLVVALAALPERERRLVVDTYLHDRTLREIAVDMGFTESRACQIRNQAIQTLRAQLVEH